MSQHDASGPRLALIMAGVVLIEAIILLWPGHLAITAHEVDVLHATLAAIRLADGEAQHIDFMTPLGILAFGPVALFMEFGLSIARAFLAAGILVACALGPAIWYAAHSRFSPGWALGFALTTLIMVMAIVYGGDQGNVSLSMAYNRWGWGAAFVIVVLITLPRRGPATIVEPIILGTLLAALALLKMTFFAMLAPIAALALLRLKDWRGLGVMALAGLGIGLIATLAFGGLAFWQGYAHDLLYIAGSDVRPKPGLDLSAVLAAPAYLPGTAAILAAVIVLRKSGEMGPGLILLLLTGAFGFITYQNWGNDPKWLILLAFLCAGWAANATGKTALGIKAPQLFAGIGIAAAAIIAPTMINLAISPLRNLMADPADFASMLDDPRQAGLMIERSRSYEPTGTIDLAPTPDPKGQEDEPEPGLHFAGVDLPECRIQAGYFGTLSEISNGLAALGYAGTAPLFVDVTNPLSAIGPFARLPVEPPWYYGGVAGAELADILVLPRCPTSTTTFRAYIDALNASDMTWTLAAEHAHFRVFTPQR